MGQRARPANKVASKRQFLSNQRGGNSLNPSDSGGIEASSSSSSGSEVAFLQSKGSKNQVHYVSSDGSLFTIVANPNHLKKSHSVSNQTQQQQQQHLASLTHNEASSGSPNSSSTTANLEPPMVTQRQQQHRRLQNQVHQQLQRIYGNNDRQSTSSQSHLVEDLNQQYMFKQQQHRQVVQQVQEQRNQASNTSQARQPTSGYSNREQNQSTQFSAAHLNNSHLMMQSNSHHHQQQQQPHQQPEQIYDSLGSTSISKHLPDVYYIQENQRQQPISAIPEECGDVEEDELLIPEVGVVTKRTAIDRKHQLEDLHYATATAAALLSATASAAAAFAANEKHYNLPEKQLPIHPQQNIINSIYSDAYQDVRKQRCLNLNDHQVIRARGQQRRNVPIYSDALDHSQFMNPANRQLHMEPPPSIPNAIYSPLTRANLAQSQLYGFLPSHQYQQYQQAANFSRPTPPHPPIRRMMNPQLDYQRQQQLQQRIMQQRAQLQQVGSAPSISAANATPQVPALAIVHQGKAAAMKANMIGRMLVNNILAAQRAAGAGSEGQYMGINGLPVCRGRSGAPNKMIEGQNLACNMMNPEKIYRPPAPMFSVTSGIAPSDSSGHSNVPLVLDRGLRPLTFIERICRIDLTLFWWSLLIVSFLFMGAIVTISRYIF